LAARKGFERLVEAAFETELRDGRRGWGVRCAGPPLEVAAKGLARERVELLRQVAGRQPRRAQPDATALRLVQPREQAQQRRLADPVRADDSDAAARADGERDAAEDLGDAVRDGDVDERDRV